MLQGPILQVSTFDIIVIFDKYIYQQLGMWQYSDIDDIHESKK